MSKPSKMKSISGHHKGAGMKKLGKSQSGGESKRVNKKVLHSQYLQSELLNSAKSLLSLRTRQESKGTIPRYRGTDSPVELSLPHPGYTMVDTSESLVARSVLARTWGQKEFSFRISTALNMSSSAGGAINSTINVNQIQFNTDFIALSGVFNEFFVEAVRVQWEPVSMYNYPLSGAIGTNVSSLPIAATTLQHSTGAYSSMVAASENYKVEFHNSGRPFQYMWENIERPSDGTTTVTSSSGATQSWALCSNVANYTGFIQFISQSAPPGLPTSQVLGTFLTHSYVRFRIRT